MGWRNEVDFESIVGKTFTRVEGKEGDEIIRFIGDESFVMYYEHDCCASCSVDDITGDLADLENTPILSAEEAISGEWPEGVVRSDADDSFTWTFYRIRTIKGTVVIRWFGTSNGYYSESVTFEKVGE